MTTTPNPTSTTVRPTGDVVARAFGFGPAAATVWFHKADKAIATYPHRRPGEDAEH